MRTVPHRVRAIRFGICVLFPIILLAVTSASGQLPDTSSAPLWQVQAAWDSLDRARTLHLSGEAGLAIKILQNIAIDSGIADPQLHDARRELTAFVLHAQGDHQRAFDTLRVYSVRRLKGMQNELDRSVDAYQHAMDSLSAMAEEHELQLSELEKRHGEEKVRGRLILVGSVSVLLLLVIFLAFKIRRSPPNSPIVPAAVVAPAAGPAESTSVRTTVMAVDRRPDRGFVHSHLSLIADKLNKGEIVEAAVHVGSLSRLMKLMDDVPAGDLLPAQQAIALLRQYLKLEAARSGRSFRYEVDADRKLLDLDLPLPVRRSVELLAKVIGLAKSSGVPLISMKAELQDAQDRPMFTVKFPADREVDPGYLTIDGARIEQHSEAEVRVVHFTWQHTY